MDRIEVKIIDEPEYPGRMSSFLARLTQRGHTIETMDDIEDLLHKGTTPGFRKSLSKLNHGTIKRFDNYTVAIVGASRRFLAQARTHQLANFVSGSLQYSDWSDNDPAQAFVVPYSLLDPEVKDFKDAYLEQCAKSFEEYRNIADAIDNDTAGYIMPNGIRNVLIIQANIQSWQYMIGLRTCKRNTTETRYVYLRIWEELLKTEYGKELFPVEATGCYCQRDKCKEGHMSCQHPILEFPPDEIIRKEYPLLVRN